MPRLVDDARYATALRTTGRMLEREQMAFRRRLASRLVGLVSSALDAMGNTYDEGKLREALEGYDRVYVEESLAYIRRALVNAGEIEIAKRLAEIADKVSLDDLPPEFRRAHDEIQRAGWFGLPHMSEPASGTQGGTLD